MVRSELGRRRRCDYPALARRGGDAFRTSVGFFSGSGSTRYHTPPEHRAGCSHPCSRLARSSACSSDFSADRHFLSCIQTEGFAVVGMAAFFTGVVRAPLTGIVLVTKMTANATM